MNTVTTERTDTISLRVQDTSGQKMATVRDIRTDASWGETLAGILAAMQLPTNSTQGQDNIWSARLEREGRRLQGDEIVGEALEDQDTVVLAPEIMAGAR